MFDRIHQIPTERVSQVDWLGNDLYYDLQLYELGAGHLEFYVVNPNNDYPEQWRVDLKYYVEEVPNTRKCIVVTYNNDWIVKIFKDGWYPYHGYETVEIIKTELAWTRNPDIDKLITYEDDPFGSFNPSKWDRDYKLVWYMDERFNPLEDKVWAFSCQPIGKEILGTKDMGYVVPDVAVQFNDHLPDLGVDANDCCPAFYDLAHECAYELDPIHQTNNERLWVVKFTPMWRKPKEWKWLGIVTPELTIVFNPELPELDYDLEYLIPWHDFAFEHVWMLDRKHLANGKDDIWAFTIQVSNELDGSKIIDYISPTFKVTLNPVLPDLKYDIDYAVPWYDLGYEQVWMLDNNHLKHGEEEIWALTASAVKEPIGSKFIDYVSPSSKFKINPALKGFNFNTDHLPAWYDLGYEHIWMLDSDYQQFDKSMWAVKQTYVNKTKGSKQVEALEPDQFIEFNLALTNLYIEIEYKIPVHDRMYEHIWYTMINGEQVWSAKLRAVKKPTGIKEMGMIEPIIPRQLDVVFISYKEPNAEENWQRLLTFAPNAKRIAGVTGILNAHKAAAKLATTDMFYVVDGDAWLVDNWTFDFQPSLYDRDCVYVWNSINPINSLTYGYGGVKLFPTSLLKRTTKWGTDLTTSVSNKFKIIDQISNETRFNASEFDTWRSAFRECAKLAVKTDNESKHRLSKWLTINMDADFTDWAKKGAMQGRDYALKNPTINRVNDYEWLEQQFKTINE